MSFAEFGSPSWSPFVIVILDGQSITDRDLLQSFGLRTVGKFWNPLKKSVPTVEITIAEGPTWKAISSGWSYSLWHNQATRPTLWRLAKDFHLFAYFMGDSDDAHSIHMFTNGGLSREFIVDDRHGGGAQEILFDMGDRLPGESDQLKSESDLYEYLSNVAKENGFDPASASRVKKWTVVEEGQSERVYAEQALARTSWEHYRP